MEKIQKKVLTSYQLSTVKDKLHALRHLIYRVEPTGYDVFPLGSRTDTVLQLTIRKLNQILDEV